MYTMTDDIKRMLEVGQREIFMSNMDAQPKEYPEFCVTKPSKKEKETYDSIGNLARGGKLGEGDTIDYNKVGQAYQTTIYTEQWANGFSVSYKAKKLDLYGVINNTDAKELANTALQDKEHEAIYWIDNIATITLADGVSWASTSHPLIASADVIDNTLTAASIANPESHKAMWQAFARGWKTHTGEKFKIKWTDALTNAVNQMDIEEVFQGSMKAKEMSNTQNKLPKNINWHYSTYMSSETAWIGWDNSYEHPVIYQVVQEEDFGMSEDNIETKNLYFNYIALWNFGQKPAFAGFYNAGV